MKAADEAAFVAFVEAHQARLHRVAYALTSDWHTAEDLVQGVLAKLYVVWPRMRRDGEEFAYARRALMRANIDRWRSRRVAVTSRRSSHAEPSPEQSVIERDSLIEALAQLPPMQRRCVVMRHLLDLDVTTTAAELGISTGTVKSHTARGIERLRAAMDPVGTAG